MTNQRRLLPSTSMLMAFDAAARANSFTIAAKELNLTQGAVSRQIHALESQLDIVLFKRVRKTVQLTEAGRIYAEKIHAALQMIRNASLDAITNPLGGMLNLGILPTFGTRWLMPRFPQFLSENPDITVNFISRLSPFDFKSDNLHAAIHYGMPDWPGTDNTFLMDEEVIPVCSPEFLREHAVEDAAGLARLPLLHLETRQNAWKNWFTAHDIEPPEKQGMLFEQISIIAQAAATGLGVALLPRFLIQGELDRGELKAVLDMPLHSQSGYYLVTPVDKSDYPPVMAFKNWLLKAITT